ncbi:MAG: GTPase domain-containing protein [Polyangiaceae bacterium]|jgi:translation elongation factor EF-4|nr:GTPase domain-containing protein [Polyangiaceae bacterium]
MLEAQRPEREPAPDDERACFRVVYEGLALSGRRANLERIWATVPPERRSNLTWRPTLEDEDGAVLTFGVRSATERVDGRALQLELVAAHGAAFAGITRRALLERADGVVIVVDSEAHRVEQNEQWLAEARTWIANDVPIVVQYNKRDLPSAVPVEELRRRFNPGGYPDVEASVLSGVGVMATLRAIARAVAERPRRTR